MWYWFRPKLPIRGGLDFNSMKPWTQLAVRSGCRESGGFWFYQQNLLWPKQGIYNNWYGMVVGASVAAAGLCCHDDDLSRCSPVAHLASTQKQILNEFYNRNNLSGGHHGHELIIAERWENPICLPTDRAMEFHRQLCKGLHWINFQSTWILLETVWQVNRELAAVNL